MKTNQYILTVIVLLFSLNNFAQCYTKISAGEFHVVAQRANGTTWTWGSNGNGEQGMGNQGIFWTGNQTQIGTDSNWLWAGAGAYATFVIKSNGTLWGSGRNSFGQIGINSSSQLIYTLTQVGTATNWKQISASTSFVVGLKTDGTIWAWGQNDTNQMGNNTCCANRLIPGQVGTANDWKTIGVSGSSSAFAIKNNGTLWAWGGNFAQMLGDNTVSSLAVPTQFDPSVDWNTLSAGYDHVLILKNNGTLWAWGGDVQGQTANNNVLGPGYVIRQIGTSTWKAIAAGLRFSIGIKTDGTLWGWGQNNIGQLGLGDTANRYLPVQIGTANNWSAISAGQEFVAALKTDGSLWAWGDNFYGQLGNGTEITVPLPTPAQIVVSGCALDTPSFELEKAVVISPNPAQSDLEIRINANLDFDSIVIFDLTGKQVYQTEAIPNSKLMVLNVANLSAGIYNVVFKNDGVKVLSKKLIKQ